jgi:LmbE family N-acetylglucosaminyl deacetylase
MTADDAEDDSTAGVPDETVGTPPDAAEPPPPRRVLSIHAHPDDQEFTVAGTLAKWARAGATIVSVCVTSGGAGSNEHTPREMTRADLAGIREEEQRNACRVLGIAEVVFLRYEDGMLEPSLALRRDLTRLVRRHRPDVVVCGDPTVRFYGNFYLNHPDHRVTGDAALDAVFPSAVTRLIFPELLDEGLEPHQAEAIYIHGATRPDTFIDISDVLDVKLAALKEHRSQMGTWDPTEFVTGWAREQGQPRGLAAAEAYRRMILTSL